MRLCHSSLLMDIRLIPLYLGCDYRYMALSSCMCKWCIPHVLVGSVELGYRLGLTPIIIELCFHLLLDIR